MRRFDSFRHSHFRPKSNVKSPMSIRQRRLWTLDIRLLLARSSSDRAADFYSAGCGFESRRANQTLVQDPRSNVQSPKSKVSSLRQTLDIGLATLDFFRGVAQLAEHSIDNRAMMVRLHRRDQLLVQRPTSKVQRLTNQTLDIGPLISGA
jgi:hypothetical protein